MIVFWRRRRASQQTQETPDVPAQTNAHDAPGSSMPSTPRQLEIEADITSTKALFAAQDYDEAIRRLTEIVDANLKEARNNNWAPAPHWYAELARAYQYKGELDSALAVLDRYGRDAGVGPDEVHGKIAKRRRIIERQVEREQRKEAKKG